MNIIRLLKIVTALCVWAVCFLFIPNMIGSEFFALKMTLYGIFFVILIFIFYKLFREILNKDKTTLPFYDYSKGQSLDILIAPARVIFLSGFMILLSSGVIAFMASCGFFQDFKWTATDNYPPLVSILIFAFILYNGIKLWSRRNEVVQLKFTPTGVEYMPVDVKGVGRGRGVSVLSMYFRTKMVSLNYDNIQAVSIDKNAWSGDMIRISTVAHREIYLPFLPNDINQFESVYNTFLERWNQSKRGIDTPLY